MYIPRDKPGPGQESTWDYPRPPAIQKTDRHIEVVFGGILIADTRHAFRVLESGHAPIYYIPRDDILSGVLKPSGRASYCEFKGEACYYHVRAAEHVAEDAAWTYENPLRGYEELLGHFAFYPQFMDECRVDSEIATPQPGQFYGGWVTSDIVGPFKGDPGVRTL